MVAKIIKALSACLVLLVVLFGCARCNQVRRERLANFQIGNFEAANGQAVPSVPTGQNYLESTATQYGPDRKQTFDFYAPEKTSDTLIVTVHGGAWVAGDKNYLAEVANFFRDQGSSVINMNYRLAPAWAYDAPLEDMASVISLVEADKSKFKLKDNFSLVLLGHSAGGHLVAQYALKENDYGTRQVNMAIGLAGPYDLTAPNASLTLLSSKIRSAFLGQTSAEAASPTKNVKTGEATQFLLFSGGDDKLVSPDQMKSFATELRAKGVTVNEYLVEGRTHDTLYNRIPTNDFVAQTILGFMKK